MHLPADSLTGTALRIAGGAVAFLILTASPAVLARPNLVPVAPYTSVPESRFNDIGSPALSPAGSRIAFVHCFNPLGLNPGASPQLFVGNVTGGGLAQVTTSAITNPLLPIWSLDGGLLYFTAEIQNPARRELFRVPAAGGPAQQITFQSAETGIHVIEKPVPVTGAVCFATAADLLNESLNLRVDERNFYRLEVSGTLTRLTDVDTQPLREAGLLGVSADGTLLAFAAMDPSLPGSRPIRPYALHPADGIAVPLTPDDLGSMTIDGWLSPVGGRLVFRAGADYTGMNGGRLNQIFRVDTSNGSIEQLTEVQTPGASHPVIDGSGNLAAFETTASILINEDSGTSRVYLNAASGIRRVSTGRSAALSLDGSRVAYVDVADSTGGNPDRSPEIYSVRTDGTDRRQHSGFVPGASGSPDISSDGIWVAFQSTADLDGQNPDGSPEIYVAKSDGSGLKRLTTTPAGRTSREPSLSAGGAFVVFSSNADLVPNQNFDHNYEVFRIRTDGSELTQISQSTTGANSSPLVAAGGDTVVFISTANIIIGAQLGSGRVAVWRNNGGTTFVIPATDRPIDAIRLSDDGTRIAILTPADLGGRNTTHVRLPYTVAPSGGFLTTVPLPGPLQASGLGLSPDGQWLAVAFPTGVLALVPYTGGSPDTILADPAVLATLPAPSTDGRFTAFSVLIPAPGYRRGDYFRVDRMSGGVVAMLEVQQAATPEAPAISGDGSRLVFTVSSPDTLNPDGSREIFAATIATTPVRLLDFTATAPSPGSVRLSWRVAADQGVTAFLIDRSTDGAAFDRVARLPGFGEKHDWLDWAAPAGDLRYRLTSIDRGGIAETLGTVTTRTGPPPARLRVSPNPVGPNSKSIVSFSLPAPGRATIRIVDVAGRLVRTLLDGDVPSGPREIVWDGTDDRGTRLGSGVYYVALNQGPAASVILAR